MFSQVERQRCINNPFYFNQMMYHSVPSCTKTHPQLLGGMCGCVLLLPNPWPAEAIQGFLFNIHLADYDTEFWRVEEQGEIQSVKI